MNKEYEMVYREVRLCEDHCGTGMKDSGERPRLRDMGFFVNTTLKELEAHEKQRSVSFG